MPVHQPEGRRRSLNTARAALRVVAHLSGSRDGATTGDISRILGKSSYTAYYLQELRSRHDFALRGVTDGCTSDRFVSADHPQMQGSFALAHRL
jgi:hypothetical protein